MFICLYLLLFSGSYRKSNCLECESYCWRFFSLFFSSFFLSLFLSYPFLPLTYLHKDDQYKQAIPPQKLLLFKIYDIYTYKTIKKTLSLVSSLSPSSPSFSLHQVLLGASPPSFSSPPSSSLPSSFLKKEEEEGEREGEREGRRLNESQRRAVEMVERSRDLAIIHGPPGTGKVYIY